MHNAAPPDAQTVALLGHDLRATLSEVIGGLRLIEPDLLPPAPRGHLARTQAASEALALLLEQALALLTQTPLHPSALPVALHTEHLLHSLRLRWTARAAEKGLAFHLHANGLPAQLPFDPAGLERILANLLNNALHYADAGTITCILQITASHHMQITVQDQGKGFAPATLARLYACDNHDKTSAEKPGSGMGLHIVWQIVTQMGGQISAANHAAGGAEVVVLLPLPQMPTAPPPAVIPAKTGTLQGRRVLIADDSETGRLLMVQYLASQGAQVTEAADGLQVLKHLGQARFDALLIDIEMPHTSGLEVIRHIRSQPGALAQLPILAVTAYQMRANKAAIRSAGADGLLCKPVLDASTLCDALLQVLQRKPGQEPSPAQIEPAQFQDLLDMAGPKMAAELLDHLQKDLRAAERGLLAAAQGPDWLEVRRQTHVMIALAGTAGANLLHQLAQSMNALAHQPVPDAEALQRLLPQTLEQLDMLIHFIDQKISPPPISNPSPRDPA
ncbi:response regulator [Cypionkella sinensis]|uniref:histidine kinase n=1 Tax=Cypionkella sinensis TaxID=1756043 RepID=A0ABV7IZ05_9RHOB